MHVSQVGDEKVHHNILGIVQTVLITCYGNIIHEYFLF